VANPKFSSKSPVRPLGEETPPIRLSAGKRREQLIQVAVDLFSRKGFKGTTTREIAAAAGVTEAIIFRHFATKEQLYTAIIDRRLNAPDAADWIAGFRAAMDRDDDEAVVRHLVNVIISAHRNDPKFERLMLYAALEGNEIAIRRLHQITASIVDLYRKYFLRRQKQGHLRPCLPDVALTAIVGMAQHYALCKYVHGVKEQCLSDEQALESFTHIAMNGLSVPGPRTRSAAKKK
jgi:TetR/AcrR family transcriptional regulator